MKSQSTLKTVLAIETSCDETAVAIVKKHYNHIILVDHLIASQIPLHAPHGGVVPEVAARAHETTLLPLIEQLLHKNHITQKDFDAIAVTQGPGLLTSLLVGVAAARTLGVIWKKPVLPVNHLAGHIAAAWINKSVNMYAFPILALLVSGGHTEFIVSKRFGHYDQIGATRDDAAGETFDKTAKILGLGYPGGPALSRLAEKGDRAAYTLPRPMSESGNLDMSFSGLKTAVKYLHDRRRAQERKKRDYLPNMAASIEQAIIDTLLIKLERAVKEIKPKTVLLAGGVAANVQLRKQARAIVEKYDSTFAVPKHIFCTDNAAMIGTTALLDQKIPGKQQWTADPRLQFTC